MKLAFVLKLYLLASVVSCFSQTPPTRTDSVIVTGTWQPLPLEEADRSVRAIDVRDMRLVSDTFTDLLRLDPSVDLRQRAPNGLQGDISIRGGTFGQTLVLLDGLRLNDVQSGHHNLDVPVPLETVGSMEILKGSGSTLYGSDAVGGVVNFVTRAPESSEFRLRAAAGNFGVNQQRGTASLVQGSVSQTFHFSRDFSTGFVPNRDYRNVLLSSDTRFRTRLGSSHLLLATRDSPFGAEQFYGNFNSWERTRSWWAAGRQEFGSKTEVGFAYRRHTDLFVLYRDRPEVFTNRHAVESFQTTARRREQLSPNANLFYGAELYRDSIVSNNLGTHGRLRGAGYASVDLRSLRRFSLNAGIRDEVWGSGNHQLSPSVSGGFWVSPTVKLRASASRAFRLPTYTDLYYQDPANRGSADLRPERASSYEAGADWNAGGRLRAGVTVFHRRESDGIDYVRTSPTDIWRATNFQSLNFTGVEADLRVALPRGQQVDFSYTALRGAQTVLEQRQSKYVFNYPVNNGIIGWQGRIGDRFVGRTRIGVVERYARDPYAVWDLYAAASKGRVRPFLQFTNLSNSRYQEIPGVAMPGRAVVGGLEWIVFGTR